MRPDEAQLLIDRYKDAHVLTDRQGTILHRIAAGSTIDQVVAELGIIAGTGREHPSQAKTDASL